MPAVTPIFGLPYQVGSDPPCFGPGTGCDNLTSVWCDFAAEVEAQLDASDLTAGRTTVAIPMARVTFTRPTEGVTVDEALAGGLHIPFDATEFDTDNMATLPLGITPRRNGIYRIDAAVSISDPDEPGYETDFEIQIGTEVPRMASLVEVVPASGGNIYFLSLRASTLYAFQDTGPLPRVVRVWRGSSIASTATLNSASLTVYWHSDL